MKGNFIKYLLLSLLQLAFISCVKETPAVESANTILYSVTVSQSPLTRVAISESEFTDGCHYVFESGDKLYVEHRDGGILKLYGVLTIASGVGTGTGRFEGKLKCLNDFVPQDNTLLSATVVGAHAASGFFNFEDPTADPNVDPGTIVTGVTYPSSVSYATLPDLVKKYSYFTGTSTYDARNFNNLTQQSVFLLFSLEVNRTKLGDPMVTTVSIKKNGNTVYSVTGVPVTGLSAVGYIQCTGVIPVTDLKSAEIWAGNLEFGETFPSDLSLAVNHYYSVKRSSLATDWFRIKAIENDTPVTFNHTGDGIKYSLDGGETWTDYNTKTTITLSAGQEICFQGSKTNYKNAKAEGGSTYGAPSNNPMVWVDKVNNKIKKCYVAGNIMTLLADREHLSVEAFDGAFSKDGVDNAWLDIDPKDPLLLPATQLTLRCYKGMFRRCTALQYAPDLPAETPAAECYSGMFRDCGNSNLKRVRIFLKAKTGDGNAKADFDYAKLGEGGYLDKWMQGTDPSTGALYCHPDMEAYWVNYWTWFNTQFANRPKKWSIIPWISYNQS